MVRAASAASSTVGAEERNGPACRSPTAYASNPSRSAVSPSVTTCSNRSAAERISPVSGCGEWWTIVST